MTDKVKKALYNADGTLNKSVLVGLVSAILLLVQQVASLAGFDLTGYMSNVQDIVNTMLAILTILGVVSTSDGGDTHAN